VGAQMHLIGHDGLASILWRYTLQLLSDLDRRVLSLDPPEKLIYPISLRNTEERQMIRHLSSNGRFTAVVILVTFDLRCARRFWHWADIAIGGWGYVTWGGISL